MTIKSKSKYKINKVLNVQVYNIYVFNATSTGLDLVIFANIQASGHGHKDYEQVGEKRNRNPGPLVVSLQIDPDMPDNDRQILFLYDIIDSRFRSLKGHYHNYGITPGIHGNKTKLSRNLLPQ